MGSIVYLLAAFFCLVNNLTSNECVVADEKYKYSLRPHSIIQKVTSTKSMKSIPIDNVCSLDKVSVRALCAKAVQLSALRKNHFHLNKNGFLPEAPAMYALDYTLEHAGGRNRIGFAPACACPTKPAPIYLREGVLRNVVLVMVQKQYLNL